MATPHGAVSAHNADGDHRRGHADEFLCAAGAEHGAARALGRLHLLRARILSAPGRADSTRSAHASPFTPPGINLSGCRAPPPGPPRGRVLHNLPAVPD